MISAGKPYLSVVVTARNDNHGGDMLHRMEVFLHALTTQCRRYSLATELILVEWNPPEDKPRIRDALAWPDVLEPLSVRFIEVPPSIHRTFQNSDKFPLFQMIAKNVGIRRAYGEFVLATNIDILFSNELMAFLARRELREDHVYRLDRWDVGCPRIPGRDLDAQLAFCEANLIRVHTALGSEQRTPEEFRRRRAALSREVPADVHALPQESTQHTNACGDFTLVARSRWHELRAYPEIQKWSLHIDSAFMHMAAAAGLKQRTLPYPMQMFHIEHEIGWAVISDTTKVRPSLDYERDCVPWFRRMIKERRPLNDNDDRWGLVDHDLAEDVVVSGSGSSPRKASAEGAEHSVGGGRVAAPALTLFTVPKAFTGHTAIIQRNALESWTRLSPRPEIILLGSEAGVAEAARELGVLHVPELETTPMGTPLLSSVFALAQARAKTDFVAYVNADIILGDDFAGVAPAMARAGVPCLAVGRRWDLEVREALAFGPGWFERLKADARARGILHASDGIDYFLFPKGLYPRVPPFAIGRTVWDNWLIWATLTAGARVVDCTPSVTVIHQEHAYTHQRGGVTEVWRGEEARRNRALAAGRLSTIADARFALEEGAVVAAEPRHRFPEPTWEHYELKCRLAVEAYRRGELASGLDHVEFVEMNLAGRRPPRGLFLLKARLMLGLGGRPEAEAALATELSHFPESAEAKGLLQTLSTARQDGDLGKVEA